MDVIWVKKILQKAEFIYKMSAKPTISTPLYLQNMKRELNRNWKLLMIRTNANLNDIDESADVLLLQDYKLFSCIHTRTSCLCTMYITNSSMTVPKKLILLPIFINPSRISKFLLYELLWFVQIKFPERQWCNVTLKHRLMFLIRQKNEFTTSWQTSSHVSWFKKYEKNTLD